MRKITKVLIHLLRQVTLVINRVESSRDFFSPLGEIKMHYSHAES